MAEKDLESRVTKLEADIKRCEEAKEEKWKADLYQCLKEVKDHLTRQDKEIKKQSYLAAATVGCAIIIVGVTFQIQTFIQAHKGPPDAYIWFLLLIGFGFLFWCYRQQKKIK